VQVPEPGEGEESGRLFRRLALVPSNLFPTSFCVGGSSTSPAGPRASHQPSTHPHSLLVCVVKSSQYSSPESVNSSVPCPLSLPKGGRDCCPLPSMVHLPSSLHRSLAHGDPLPPPERKLVWRSHSSFYAPGFLSQDGTCANHNGMT
jgi:hypothetical protein